MTETTTRLPIALALAAGGQRVLPWRSVVIDGKTVKRPLINDWPSKATTDPATIEKWWEQWPDAQIGRIPGEGEAILDVDTHPGKPNGYETIKLDCLEVPDTLCFSTPSGGLHRVYEYDGPTLAKMIGLRPGIDRLTSESGWVGFYGDESDARRLVSREGVAPLPTWAAQGRAKSKLNGQGTHIDAADFKARLVLPDKPYRADGPFPAIVKPERFESWDGMKKAVWEWAQAAAEGNEGARTALVEMRNAWYDRPHSSPDDVWQHEWAECLSSAVRKNGKPRYDEEAMLGDEEPSPEPEQEEQKADIFADRFARTDLSNLFGSNKPEREWTVKGLIPKGCSVSIIAPAGAGKSLLAIRLALDVSRGQDFVGMEVRQGKVLYIDLENTEVDLAERLEALGITEADVASLDGFIHLCLPPIDPLDTKAGATLLSKILDLYEIGADDLIIFDSTQRMVEGAEDLADTWRAFYNHTALMLKRRRLTSVRLDNTGKDVSRGGRGSSGKRDDVDVEWLYTRKQHGGLRLKNGKGRLISGLEDIEMVFSKGSDGQITYAPTRFTHESAKDVARRFLEDAGVGPDEGLNAAWAAVRDMPGRPSKAVIEEAQKERQELLA